MAVYKPTLCAPFLNGVDARIGFHNDMSESAASSLIKFLTCRVDTSNKNVTGYKVRIFDSANNQVFPLTTSGHDRISPIQELQYSIYDYVAGGINSGINGTSLHIPFFQNVYNKSLANRTSFNAIYYSDQFLADHVLMTANENPFTHTLTHMETLTNWTRNSANDTLTYNWPDDTPEEERRKNVITIDGDRLMLGEVILALGTADERVGLWKVTSSTAQSGSGNTVTTVLTRLTTVAANQRITVVKGADYHNTSWKCTAAASATTHGAIAYASIGGKWYDSLGSEISGFGVKDNTYKWEITLYQGNNNGIVEISGGGKYVEYTNVDSEWMDMTLSSGKIMGTTTERIQIGGVFGSETAADYRAGILPTGTSADPLVLQGKYIELAADKPTSILSGDSRLYVKTYDTAFGHVYPMTDTLNTTVAGSAQYCQFFEHSNNQEDILDTDIVDYVCMSPKTINFYKVSNNTWTLYDNEASWLANTSVSERYLVLSQKITGVEDGSLVLLAGQTSPKQNGVYSYYVVYDGTTARYCLKRAASYTSWSAYIGKVIYAINGDSARMVNMQSLATGGTYTLWNPQNTTSGSSYLYFVKERPILLFRDKLKNERTFNLFNTTTECPASGSSAQLDDTVDGVLMQVGDLVLFKDGYYSRLMEASASGYIFGDRTQLADGDYFYILNGKTLGKLVFKWDSSITPYTAASANWDLYTAKVLHNTPTRTFISPWSGLKTNMKLCLLDNKEVYYKKTDTFTQFTVATKWITISNYNDKLYFVEHDALSSVGNVTTAVPLASYSSNDESVPWKYDIKFFFRASDENPFYAYETPYIKLYKNGEEYSDASMVGGSAEYYVKAVEGAIIATQAFLAKTSPSSQDWKSYIVTMYTQQAAITGRSVTLGAEYMQYGQSSWESYEWLLYNDKFEIVQDTGKKYDKDMSVTFYGLSNDTYQTISYTAVLLIENDYGDLIQYILVLDIAPGTASQYLTSGTFTATPDCLTQSVIIHFDGLTGMDKTYSIYRREYEVFKNPSVQIEGFYCLPNSPAYTAAEWGKFFTDSSCTKEIYPKSARYLYKDTNPGNGKIYQYNSDYGVGREYLYEFTPAQTYKIFRGEWEPVLVQDTKTDFRDFNITNHRSYQYIIYPGESQTLEYGLDTAKQTFANYNGKIWQIDINDTTQGVETTGTLDTSATNGEAVATGWQYWSIAELVPEELTIDAPIVKRKYRVDTDNLWLFKYSVDTGAQTQNFTKEEFQSLGRFAKFGFGLANADSGSVTALLGSEIIPGYKTRYIERLRDSRVTPLSSNEKAQMLAQWRNFCFSSNPKLLKDIKGQSWIVQILSNTNTPQNFVANVPDTISFQWKQVDTTDNAIIYSDLEDNHDAITTSYGSIPWSPMYSTKK